MKKYLGYLLTGVMAVSLVGCGGSSTASTTTTTAGTTTADAGTTDTTGSSLVVAIGSQFDTLDPALSTTAYNAYVIGSIYSGLFYRNADGSTTENFCESYETSEDGLTWTFHLRDDVYFTDGTPITSANYEYAYLRALSYGVDNAFRVNDMKQFIVGAEEYSDNSYTVADFDCTTADHSGVGIECPDDYTLVLTLNYPVSYLPVDLSGGGVWSPLPLDTPQHESAWSLEPGYATNGEYELVEFAVNDKAVLTKSDTYFNQDAVLLENITYQVMPDQDAQYAAFQTGDVDVALSVSTDTALQYKGTDNLWVLNYPSTYSICVNSGETGPEALQDVNVRKALYISIDKEAIVDVIGGSDIYPILDGYVPFGFEGITDDFRTERDAEGYELTYDTEKAVQLLNEAGYTAENPLHLTYKYSKNSFHEDVATMLQSMWEALGCVEVDFDAVESGVYYSQIDDGDIELGRYGLQTSDSPISMLKNWTAGQLVTDLVGDDGVYDKMIEDARMISDPDEFLQALHDAEDYLIQEMCFEFPLFQFATPALVQDYVSGYELHGTSLYFSKVVIDK